MEGGGVRGIAYVGAIQALEEENKLTEIRNIAGTSVGAITATFLCIGYTSEELREELSSVKLQQFNDGRGIFIGGIHRTTTRYGWYRGEKLTNWINKLIEKKTNISDLTFAQLKAMSDTNHLYKNLFVAATNLTQQRTQILSFSNFPEMRIADAVRISASIPLYYSAIFVDADGNIYDAPPKNVTVDVLADGGFLANYPIQVFDNSFKIDQTIGLRLDENDQIKKDTSGNHELATYKIDDFRDYVGAFYNIVIENLNRCDLTEEDWNRTVSISTCGIGPRVRKLKESEINTLIQSGYDSVKKYLADSESF